MTKQEKLDEGWKELEAPGMVKLEPGDSFEGDLVEIKETELEGGFKLTVEINGEMKSTYVSKIVDDFLTFNKVKPGKRIKIVFKGMRKPIKGKFDYKDYAIFVKD